MCRNDALLSGPLRAKADNAGLRADGRGHPEKAGRTLDLRLHPGNHGLGFINSRVWPGLKGNFDNPGVHGRHEIPAGQGYLPETDHQDHQQQGKKKKSFFGGTRPERSGKQVLKRDEPGVADPFEAIFDPVEAPGCDQVLRKQGNDRDGDEI